MDMRGLQVEHNVAVAGMVRCAESCWRSNLHMQQRENAQVLSNELEQMSWLSCGSVDRLEITIAKLACKCVGGKDVRHKAGLLHGSQ